MLPFLSYLSTANQDGAMYLSFENEAVVQEIIQQGKVWRVYYEATFWNARCTQPVVLNPGDTVYVVGMQNITLIIEPGGAEDAFSDN